MGNKNIKDAILHSLGFVKFEGRYVPRKIASEIVDTLMVSELPEMYHKVIALGAELQTLINPFKKSK